MGGGRARSLGRPSRRLRSGAIPRLRASSSSETIKTVWQESYYRCRSCHAPLRLNTNTMRPISRSGPTFASRRAAYVLVYAGALVAVTFRLIGTRAPASSSNPGRARSQQPGAEARTACSRPPGRRLDHPVTAVASAGSMVVAEYAHLPVCSSRPMAGESDQRRCGARPRPQRPVELAQLGRSWNRQLVHTTGDYRHVHAAKRGLGSLRVTRLRLPPSSRIAPVRRT